MLAAHGLAGHVRNNDLRATGLLAAFAIYIGLLWFAACLLFSAIGFDLRVVTVQLETGHQLKISRWMFALETAEHVAMAFVWVPLVLAAGWLVYAYLMRRRLVREATGSQSVSRSLEPKLYDMVEALAIGTGMPMPAIEIIESNALNAYASGWSPADSVVGITRGLLQNPSRDELEAVLAHEITHIRYRDVRLMTVATIFVGFLASASHALGGAPNSGPTRNLAFRTSGGAGIVIVAIAMVISALASVLGLLSQLALSRTREFLADAGAVELTKNPDALITALRKIAAHDQMLAVPSRFRAMLIWSPLVDWMVAHPSIESRIAALETYAGGKRAVAPSPQTSLRRPNIPGGGVASRNDSESARPFGRRASIG
jgi:heat shock protein HtpX